MTEGSSPTPPSGRDRRLSAWEATAHRLLHRIHLDHVRSKVLAFALVATLAPALTMSWHSYSMNREYVTEKIAEELRNASTQTARELNLWLKERFYETRVFSSSYEVSENLEQLVRAPESDGRTVQARGRLIAYLGSVRAKFSDYDEIAVLDLAGRSLVPARAQGLSRHLPPEWVKQIEGDRNVIGDAYRDDGRVKPVMLIAVPIKAASGRLLGAMVGKLNFDSVETVLTTFVVGTSGHVRLIDRNRSVIVSSASAAAGGLGTRLPVAATKGLGGKPERITTYVDARGRAVIGAAAPVAALGWVTVADIAREEAYGRLSRQRNVTLLMLGGLVIGIGLAAYVLALTVVRPLDRLTTGATEVGAGDFQVDLPVLDYGEVGYLTRAFNSMVSRLREGRDELAAINLALDDMNRELKTLSVTDGLTGLFNHKHLTETLANEVARARRLKHPLAICMIDVDHFKGYNDRFGHQMGDKLLADVAALVKPATRSIDYAARYGGDEFVLILYEVGAQGAMQVAERVRKVIAAAEFGPEHHRATVSIGVASYPEHGDTAEAIIAGSDAALYEAKRQGRNRTIMATGAAGEATSRRGR